MLKHRSCSRFLCKVTQMLQGTNQSIDIEHRLSNFYTIVHRKTLSERAVV
jgi:hypothetical protein